MYHLKISKIGVGDEYFQEVTQHYEFEEAWNYALHISFAGAVERGRANGWESKIYKMRDGAAVLMCTLTKSGFKVHQMDEQMEAHSLKLKNERIRAAQVGDRARQGAQEKDTRISDGDHRRFMWRGTLKAFGLAALKRVVPRPHEARPEHRLSSLYADFP